MIIDLEIIDTLIEKNELSLALSPDIISSYFDKGASSLFNLIQFSERNVKGFAQRSWYKNGELKIDNGQLRVAPLRIYNIAERLISLVSLYKTTAFIYVLGDREGRPYNVTFRF